MELQVGLHEYLDESIPEKFVIDNDEKANWALRKLKKNQDKKLANKLLAEAEITKIKEWLEKANTDLDNDINYFTGLLQEYAMKQKQEDPKFKSAKLPNGKYKFKKQQPEFKRDETALLNYLKENKLADYIETKESAKWGELKKKGNVQGDKFVYEDGTIVEGVTVIEREDTFEVEVD